MANEKAIELMGVTLTIGTLALKLKSIQLLGVDGGDPIDATTLANTDFMTKQPQTLKEMMDFSFTCQYFADDLTKVLTEVNKLQSLSITGINPGFSENFWGWLKSYEPRESGKGEEATASGTVVVACMDTNGVEQSPTVS
jgi:hypothetical protein